VASERTRRRHSNFTDLEGRFWLVTSPWRGHSCLQRRDSSRRRTSPRSVTGYTIRQPTVTELTCDFDGARTLSSNHMPRTTSQVIDLGAFTGDSTCSLSPAVVTGARDVRARDRSPLVSAAPTLLSAPSSPTLQSQTAQSNSRRWQRWHVTSPGARLLRLVRPTRKCRASRPATS
jgi:hypothetical protein